MKLRQAALKSARDMWADYILVSFLASYPEEVVGEDWVAAEGRRINGM